MIPVEILGLFTKPFALTVRLFANMVAGHFVILALLGLIFAISVWVFPVSVALALAIFMLELFVAFVQAYIFTMLSALFIGAGLRAPRPRRARRRARPRRGPRPRRDGRGAPLAFTQHHVAGRVPGRRSSSAVRAPGTGGPANHRHTQHQKESTP